MTYTLTLFLNLKPMQRSAHDASHTTSQHRTEWAWGKGGGGYDSGGGGSDSDEDDQDEHRTGDDEDDKPSVSSSVSSSLSSSFFNDATAGARSRTDSMVSLKESVALMTESPSKRKRNKPSRWSKGKFTLKVEEHFGWDFNALPKTSTTSSTTANDGTVQVSQEVQVVCAWMLNCLLSMFFFLLYIYIALLSFTVVCM
jgi:hypothetical protein